MFPNAICNIGLFQDYNTLDNDRPLDFMELFLLLLKTRTTKLEYKNRRSERDKTK